ncbi:ABC transporter permease [Methanobacterium spitsbergense]|uniref:ABC transporter permease n=1 Tax=Methanobacterium spitsbergense TaxID=2874285 RepID=A0A8T5URM1_9EURY|nr:ABC transporter permease [Methanobacterium spitsbergense]MBZ2166692.1 ABC transporter permease [Methanobacterium spitsbergense]
MSFLSLVVKNPFRNKTRSSLAIVGIAIGIMVIVALGMVTGGLKNSTQSTLKAGAAEITVVQAGSNSFGQGGTLNDTFVSDLLNISGVKDTTGILRASNTSTSGQLSNSSSESFGPGGISVTGIDTVKLSLIGVDSVNGTVFSNDSTDQVILGKTIAESLNQTVGDTINLYGKDFKITGTYETGNFITDAGIMMPLSTLQNLTSNEGKVSNILVKVTDNANVTTVSKSIEDAYPNELTTTTAEASASRINQGLSFIDTASWAISLLAIFIGAVGVINTMIMSVYERTREIGVLKAVGWTERRILGMILGESVVLTLIAFVVGTVIAVVGVELILTVSPSVGGIINPSFAPDIFLRAFVVAFLVGVIGGLYPAYRASRLSPTEALRYE